MSPTARLPSTPSSPASFSARHIGPRDGDVTAMLKALGYETLEQLIDDTLPASIRMKRALATGDALTESNLIHVLQSFASENELYRSFIGQGYYGCHTPAVIQRNILENPGWYTAYTPYQAEISQGRLEALVNYQTLVADLTGLPLANASLLDEATAAAEALNMCIEAHDRKRTALVVSEGCHPQVIEVIKTRAEPLGIVVTVVAQGAVAEAVTDATAGVLLAYPGTTGQVHDVRATIAACKARGAHVAVASDLLALCLLTPPGELGADIAIGSAQRFGVPMGFGGPHAAFMASREEFRRQMPGRIIGVSRDAAGNTAYRLALQTREQHIRREKATSNICTAQVLLAVMASMYAVYHGPDGLTAIAKQVHRHASALATGLRARGFTVEAAAFFDTIKVRLDAGARDEVVARAEDLGINLRVYPDGLGISVDETTSVHDLEDLLGAFGNQDVDDAEALLAAAADCFDASGNGALTRQTPFLTHPTFHRYRSEHDMLRYMSRLERKDLSLTTSMIALGSCTMKLNATSEMLPVTWPEFSLMHPYSPAKQAGGYTALCTQLAAWLKEITGFTAISLQPNSGAQGEYAGLLAIRGYHAANGQGHRNICLIPNSAHGTNPASAVMAGMKVVPVAVAADGTIDMADLTAKAQQHGGNLAAVMVTYPSTHGVFEENIKELCATIHGHGGLVYMDGANMNAQVGLCRPADIGADVCHLNLHKTFCIPHGGGGPGMGPIGVTAALAPYLPRNPIGGEGSVGAVSAAPLGSASILPISFSYIAMMGGEGLTRATQVAILNANYMAERLGKHFPILYRGAKGRVAHEFILDCRGVKKTAGVEAEDLAKRLMDYGFHAPTMSFPVPGTLMIEPTESESKEELDRFCDAMIAIRAEIAAIEAGTMDKANNPLKMAPHTAAAVTATEWNHPYSREQAAYPLPYLREQKYWPSVARVDNAYGDRNLMCTCPPMEDY